MDALVTLLDRSRAPARPILGNELRRLYGGDLVFPRVRGRAYVVANFVSTLDGVVSYGVAGKSGGGPVSGFNRQDAFVMGLLRARADAVMVGSGTLHGDPGHVRTAPFVFREAEHQYAELRRSLRKSSLHPLNVIVSGSGRVDLAEPTFHTPGLRTLIVTSRAGRTKLRAEHGNTPDATSLATVGDRSHVPPARILKLLHDDLGVRLLLHEGGPTLLAQFLARDLIDELFLTVAPRIAGRTMDARRPGFAQSVAFPPDAAPGLDLISVKYAGDHLLLRYRSRMKR